MSNSTRPDWFFASIIARLRSECNGTSGAVTYVYDFFTDYPVRSSSCETRDALRDSLLAGLLCDEMSMPLPPSAQAALDACHLRGRYFYRHHHGLRGFAPEVFCTSQGLETLHPRVLAHIRARAAMDVCAYIGDSAVVLMDFARDVYCFEPSPANLKILKNVLYLNHDRFGKGHAVPLALSDTIGTATFQNAFDSEARFESGGSNDVTVNVSTLDAFVEANDITVGLVKCDTEGHGLPVIMGALKTIRKQRPVLAIASYHRFEELFGVPIALRSATRGYEFGWEFGVHDAGRLNEVILIGYPRELLDQDE